MRVSKVKWEWVKPRIDICLEVESSQFFQRRRFKPSKSPLNNPTLRHYFKSVQITFFNNLDATKQNFFDSTGKLFTTVAFKHIRKVITRGNKHLLHFYPWHQLLLCALLVVNLSTARFNAGNFFTRIKAFFLSRICIFYAFWINDDKRGLQISASWKPFNFYQFFLKFYPTD